MSLHLCPTPVTTPVRCARIVEEYGFPEQTVLNGAEVFTLAADTVRQRLALMSEVSEVSSDGSEVSDRSGDGPLTTVTCLGQGVMALPCRRTVFRSKVMCSSDLRIAL